jgi:hypothetical protein
MAWLWLDDIRNPPTSSWDVARSYDEFVAYAKTHPTNTVWGVSLDHDLADEHYEALVHRELGHPVPECAIPDGVAVVRWMVEHKWFPHVVVIHTYNPHGRATMRALLEDEGYHCSSLVKVPDAYALSPYLIHGISDQDA